MGSDRSLVICACVFLVGLALLVDLHLPILNPEQCPLGYTQEQVDRSNCIIGANIGVGLLWEVGVLLALVGGIALLVCIAARLGQRYTA